jgi:hypothetical protein
LSSNSNGRNFSFCIPRLTCHWSRNGTAAVDWSWVFHVVPLESDGRSRLIFRWRAASRPWWLTVSAWLVIIPADFIMSKDMLRGVKRRAERVAGNTP